MHHAPLAVAEDLHLDVARGQKRLLQIERPIAKGLLCLLGAAGEGLRQTLALRHGPNAPSAPAADGLQHEGAGMGFLKGQGVLEARGPFRARQQGNAKGAGQGPGLGFRAEGAELGWGRAKKDQPRAFAALGKGCVLRQKAVARMNSGGAAGLGRGEDGVLVEVGRRAGAR